MKSKRFLKNVPIRILVVVILCGLVGLIANLILSTQLNKVIKIHQEIMHINVQNREYMSKINIYMYKHQFLLSNHYAVTSEPMLDIYEEKEKELRENLTDLVVDFSYRIKGGEREKTYHAVYSDFAGYCKNVDTLLHFSRNNEKEMAAYYNETVLKPFLQNIDEKLAALDSLTEKEINASERTMMEEIKFSRILRIFLFIIITALVVTCSIFCLKITADLDRYKRNLEEELKQKNSVLQEHNKKQLKIQTDLIYGMANMIENRNSETGEHVKRTSNYVEMICKEAQKQGIYKDQITDSFVEVITKVAPLHDVGKIVIPDSILTKPGKLTVEEFNEIKKHVSRGGEIIHDCFESIENEEYIDMAINIATYHHERWDGNGYIKHLSKQEIPLSARIMSIADVFDALISKRCYKEAYSLNKAFEIIKEGSGSQFDPQLVQVFLTLRPEIEKFLQDKQ